ncbi:hypothetical protein AB0A63_17775 [Lentzea sp. NPDC042327]|uniref:hypothetical protein n=1 Tax=Lentzea sp. NPDC042327 TaxID=3154801 RepID=UPI0033F71AB1
MIRERLREELDRPSVAPDVQLAVALSTATRIEAELVRAVRLGVLPHLDVGAESDFWFSDWVGARQPQVVALRSDLLDLLRDRLARYDEAALETLRAIMLRSHRNLSPALALEEDVTWHACTGGEEGFTVACALLRRASKAMVVQGRDGVAGWVADAVHRLPREVLRSTDGWHAVLNARRTRSEDITAEPEHVDARVIEEILIPVAHGQDDSTMRRCVGVRWDDGVLVLGEGVDGGVTIRLPHHVPPLVELVEYGNSEGDWHLIGQSPPFRPVRPGPVRLRTLDGRVFDIPEAVGDRVQASPVLVQVEGAQGEPARFWLQPVRFETGERARAGQPVALLTRVLDTIPADPGALSKLHGWLAQEEVCAVRLLHGWTEEQRIRLATQIAAAGEREGWHVFRGRQDPAAAQWLRSDKPQPGPKGVLLVVDRADSWHPQHLRGMLAALLDGSARTRVLLLSLDAGSWWNAVARAFPAADVHWAAQRLDADPPRERTELYRRAIDVMADAMSADLDPARDPRGPWTSQDDVELVAVAAALDALTRKTRRGYAGAAKLVLRHEHVFRTRRAPEHDGQLAALVFLATLLRPLHVGAARDLCLHFELIDAEHDWRPLLAAYERLYPLDQEALDPLGPCQLADDLLAGVLVDKDADLGVDPDWAVRLLDAIATATFPEDPGVEPHSMAALAHASARFRRLATGFLNPIVHSRPELLVRAGAAAIMTALANADTELLERIHGALPPPDEREVHLDPAVVRLELALVDHLRSEGAPSPERDAPLDLRLARSQARAGLLEAALTTAAKAADGYRRLVVREPRVHTTGLCESLVLQSGLLGELNQSEQALAVAEEAESRLRTLQVKRRDEPGSTLASALANLGRQRARSGNTGHALRDVREAVTILRDLAGVRRAEYEPELCEVLVNLAERAGEAGEPELALSAVEEAVALAARLHAANKWAHLHRYAAALAGRWRWTGSASDLDEAVSLYRQAAQASPERFDLALAGVLVDRSRTTGDLSALEEAIGLYQRHKRAEDELAAAVALRDQWEGGSV